MPMLSITDPIVDTLETDVERRAKLTPVSYSIHLLDRYDIRSYNRSRN